MIPWTFLQIHYVASRNPWSVRVRLLHKKGFSVFRNVIGRQMAVAQTCKVIIPVGTRVVAIFNDVFTSNYYSGIIAETPKSTNKYR